MSDTDAQHADGSSDAELGECDAHPHCVDTDLCVNCGTARCAACAADGDGLSRCVGCENWVCAPGDCDLTRGEGPRGKTLCEICGAGFCAGCLMEARPDDDPDYESDYIVWVCKWCYAECEQCGVACARCYERAACCECECALVGFEFDRYLNSTPPSRRTAVAAEQLPIATASDKHAATSAV